MKHLIRIAVVAGIAAVCVAASAQDNTEGPRPVIIAFDRHATPSDLVTGERIPAYTRAKRGSFQFFFGRLDTPERGFWYFFDGRRFQDVERLALMRHMQPQGMWALLGGGGWRGNEPQTVRTNPVSICEVQHHAVSFIPLDEDSGRERDRVYVLLDDLHLIQWHPVDHWLATMPQEEYEALRGIKY